MPLVSLLIFGGWGLIRPQGIPALALVVPFGLSLALIAQFERVREFVRKPDVIGNYVFANGIREFDLPLLQRDGMLKHATYCNSRFILPDNRLEAGQNVFWIACSRCYTVHGVNTESRTTLSSDIGGDQ